ncbi:MAG: acyl carrier protein [Lachnospiraceae bacterium]|nr:acyl carrier protein [Lachnospiraceae bacterium]
MNKEEVKRILIDAVSTRIQDELRNDLSLDLEIVPLGINSLSFIQIIVELEDGCDIEFDDDSLDFYKFRTLEDVYNYTLSKLDIENS